MEEIQEQNQQENYEVSEPEADNSETEQFEKEGQSEDPSNLILGKFKSVEDLSKAYQEIEKQRGLQSEELGILRQNAVKLKDITDIWDKAKNVKEASDSIKEAVSKYEKYFIDPSFKQMYKEAYLAMGKNLDVDRFVNLLEGYVASRIFAHERTRAAEAETVKATDSMTFSKNEKSSLTPPKKRLDEMTPKEVDDLLERLI